MQEHEKQVPIWFFIGAMLAVYGVLILGTGIYGWVNPPPVEQRVKLWEYHADVWWGAMMVVAGLVYVVKFWPSETETITGKSEAAPQPEPQLEKR